MVQETTADEQLDHRCLSGRKCAARSGEQAAATAKPDTLCPACIDAIQNARNRLPALREAVTVFVRIKPVTGESSKVAGTKEPAIPLNVAAATLVSDIDEVLARVGNYQVRDLVAHPAKRFKAWLGGVEQIVEWDGTDLASQIRRVYERAVTMVGLEPQWQRRHAPCWECNLPCLGQFAGNELVECSNCGAKKHDSDYDVYCVELAARGK